IATATTIAAAAYGRCKRRGAIMSDWYVFDGAVESGPLGDAELAAYLKNKDASHVYVWREGFADWKLARDVAQIAQPRPPRPAVPGRRVPLASDPGIEE